MNTAANTSASFIAVDSTLLALVKQRLLSDVMKFHHNTFIICDMHRPRAALYLETTSS